SQQQRAGRNGALSDFGADPLVHLAGQRPELLPVEQRPFRPGIPDVDDPKSHQGISIHLLPIAYCQSPSYYSPSMFLRCFTCNAQYGNEPTLYSCRKCDNPLEVVYDDAEFAAAKSFEGRGVWRYQPLLPIPKAVTLGEGDTGLHLCERSGRDLGVPRLFVKNEGENPTGSFKDRGMTVGIAMAKAAGARAVGCASTGNTSASMAAYAARAGLTALVLLPAGKVALGKLSQAIAHGAKIAQVDGNFDDAMRLVVELSVKEKSVYLLNSLNPYRLEGQKTLAFEVCEALGDAPDALVLPMGNAGNISAIWKGFLEWKRLGRISRLPRMIGVQAEKAAPIARAWASKGE